MISILQGTVALSLSQLRPAGSSKLMIPNTSRLIFRLIYFYFRVHLPVLSNSDHVICVSREIKNEVLRYYYRRPKRLTVIPNGIDCSLFSLDLRKREKIRSKYGLKDNECLLLSLGTINQEKGHHDSIFLLKRLLDHRVSVKLMIVGEGPALSDLRKLSHQLKIRDNLIFTGYVSNENTSAYYNAADIYFFFSKRKEGLPFSVLEALSCGKPVISFNTGSLQDAVITDYNGYLYPFNIDFDVIVSKVREMTTDFNLLSRLSQNARKHAQLNYNKKKMIEATIRCFESVVEQYVKIGSGV